MKQKHMKNNKEGPKGGRSLGGAGGSGAGWQGMGKKTTYPRKVAHGQGGAGVAQRVPKGGKSLGGTARLI